MASYFDRGIIVFGVAIFALGLLCAILRLDQSAYRFAGVTLTIIVLIARPQEAWITGLHRFVEARSESPWHSFLLRFGHPEICRAPRTPTNHRPD